MDFITPTVGVLVLSHGKIGHTVGPNILEIINGYTY